MHGPDTSQAYSCAWRFTNGSRRVNVNIFVMISLLVAWLLSQDRRLQGNVDQRLLTAIPGENTRGAC